MKYAISEILNLPWTILGVIIGLISIPKKISFSNKALIFKTSSWWWTKLFSYMKGVRGQAIGSVVILGQNALPFDLEHELIHINQHRKYPLIFPFLYFFEHIRVGYKNNRFEKEAYLKAGNEFKG